MPALPCTSTWRVIPLLWDSMHTVLSQTWHGPAQKELNRVRIWVAILGVLLLCAGAGAAWHFGEPSGGKKLAGWGAAGADLERDLEEVDSSYKLSAHETLSRVILQLREDYVDPRRIKPYKMFLGALTTIQKTVPEVRIDDREAPQKITVTVGDKAREFEPGGLDKLWEVTMALRDIFRFLQQEIADPKVRKEVEFAAINGMLSTLDPHSVLLDPESFADMKMSTTGEFGGLGIVISVRESHLMVVSPIADTPASRVGIKPKDKIVRIGEQSTANMTLDEAITRLRGEPGTTVRLWVMRKGWGKAHLFELERAKIKIESVTSKLLRGGIGYVKVKSFQKNTYEDLSRGLAKMQKRQGRPLKGLILDLRNNPGGLLEQAALIVDRFVKSGPLVITVGWGNKRREVKEAHADGTDDAYPIAVLVNGGSASASEIVAGALKNHDRAVLIGQNTFGKGSVQLLYDLKKSQAALKLTIAQYLIPGDESIQSVGIMPDIETVPVVADKDHLEVFSEYSGLRERDLEQHLEQHKGTTPSTGKAAAPAVARIVHLLDTKALEAEAASNDPPAEFRNDFEIQLARELLVGARSNDRQLLLDQSEDFLDSKTESQEGKLSTALSSLGLNWKSGPSATAPQVEVSFDMPLELRAGDSATMTARIKNTGTEPLFQVHGVTKSDYPLLAHREFAFGYLAPGASRTWNVKIELPTDMNARGDHITFRVGDEHHDLDSVSVSRFVSIKSLPRPKLSYAVRVDDSATGNGDGVLQPGEQAKLLVRVGNLSAIDAEEVTVIIKGAQAGELVLDHNKVSLKTIAHQGFKTAKMPIKLGKAETKTEQSSVKVRVRAWDAKGGATVAGVVLLPVAEGKPAITERRALKTKQELTILSGAHSEAPAFARVARGTHLQATARVGQYWRVNMGGDAYGFVLRSEVSKEGKNQRRRSTIKPLSGESAPELHVQPTPLVVNSADMQISGNITDNGGMRDMFVFVNERKVFYESLTHATGKHAFKINLSLDTGSNRVSVIVRKTEETVSTHSFRVYRRTPGEMARQ